MELHSFWGLAKLLESTADEQRAPAWGGPLMTGEPSAP